MDTYNALLKLYINYMDRIQAEPLTWDHAKPDEVIKLEWRHPDRRPVVVTSTFHFQMIVQAQIILLTYGPDHGDTKTSELFRQLLSYWSPRPPVAFYADGRANPEFELVPVWLKFRMIRSDVQVLVDSVLEGLHASDLVLFIQSFGIPTASMTKLLRALDRMVAQDLEGIQKATKGELTAYCTQRPAL